MTSAETGRAGETAAAAFLEARGMTVLDRNFRFAREEIDLVCFEPTPDGLSGTIVVVEVKARRGTGFGAPEAAVDQAKQQAIMRVTEAYLHERRLMPTPIRFDVIAVAFAGKTPTVTHFPNAFGYFV